MSNELPKDSVGAILLERKLVTRAQLDRAAKVVAEKGVVIGAALVDLGIVPQSIVDDAIREQRDRQAHHNHRSTARVVKASEGVIALAATISHEMGGKLS